MKNIFIHPRFRVTEGFCSLMSHYTMLYCIQKDTDFKACYITDNYSNNSAMNSFHNIDQTALQIINHDMAFPNFKQTFTFIKETDIDNSWQLASFVSYPYQMIIDILNSLSDHTKLLCDWRPSYTIFKKYISDIIDMYTFHKDIVDICQRTINNNSVAVCVRNEYKKITCPHVILTAKYYDAAFKMIDDYQDKEFLIFTDDLIESKNIFHDMEKNYNIVYVPYLPSAIGLCAMSLCKFIINANSSFSFWASILNRTPEKIICPTQYIDNKKDPNAALFLNYKWYPDTWIGLDLV